jgi:hypothetical protein
MEPFDAYLKYLLDLTVHLKESDLFQFELDENAPPNFDYIGAKNFRWTLWVSKQVRDLFDDRKTALSPEKTHAGFIELLFSIRNYLDSKNQLAKFVFVKTCPTNFFDITSSSTTNYQPQLAQNRPSISTDFRCGANESFISLMKNNDTQYRDWRNASFAEQDSSYNLGEEGFQRATIFPQRESLLPIENIGYLSNTNMVLDDFDPSLNFHRLEIDQKPFVSHGIQNIQFVSGTQFTPLLSSRSAYLSDNCNQDALLIGSNQSWDLSPQNSVLSQGSIGPSPEELTIENQMNVNSIPPSMFDRRFSDRLPRKGQSESSLFGSAQYHSDYSLLKLPSRLLEVSKSRSEFKRRKYSYSKISETFRVQTTEVLLFQDIGSIGPSPEELTIENQMNVNSIPPSMFDWRFSDRLPRKGQSESSLFGSAQYHSDYSLLRLSSRLSEVSKKRSEFKRRKYSYSKISDDLKSELTLRSEYIQNLSLDIVKASSLGETNSKKAYSLQN